MNFWLAPSLSGIYVTESSINQAIKPQNNTDLQEAVAAGVVKGLKELTQDPAFVASFWRHGFEELSKHSSNGASQWIGKRLLTILITAVTTAGIVWLVKTGAIK